MSSRYCTAPTTAEPAAMTTAAAMHSSTKREVRVIGMALFLRHVGAVDLALFVQMAGDTWLGDGNRPRRGRGGHGHRALDAGRARVPDDERARACRNSL